MKRHLQRQRSRGQGGQQAREIEIPLPIRGLFVEAKTAELSGVFAGELLNWRSTGASLQSRLPYETEPFLNTALRRIPFEYGSASRYINVLADEINDGAESIAVASTGKIGFANISSNAVVINGSTAPVRYNGTAFSLATFTPDTTIAAREFDGIVGHQDRLFFWKTGDDLDFYYGEVGAIEGALTRFPLGRLGNITGSIVTCRSLTIDAGNNINDMFAIFTSTGYIVLYEGLDPGDSEQWRLASRIKAAPPIAPDAFISVGADLWMLTASGVVSVLQTIRDSSLALVNTISRPVQQDLVKQIAEGGDWSMHLSADATAVIINRVWNGAASQFIYRTDTKAWFQASYPAMAWHNLGLKTQFTALDGTLATLVQTGSEMITARLVTSWFRVPRDAGIAFIRPTIIAKGPLTVSVWVLSDHNATAADLAGSVQTVTLEPETAGDGTETVALSDVIACDAVGEVFQIRIEVTATWAEIVNMKAGIL